MQTIIDVAHNLDLKVVAEGVETEEVLNTLDAFGCDYFQGYYYSPPLNYAALKNWIADYESARLDNKGFKKTG